MRSWQPWDGVLFGAIVLRRVLMCAALVMVAPLGLWAASTAGQLRTQAELERRAGSPEGMERVGRVLALYCASAWRELDSGELWVLAGGPHVVDTPTAGVGWLPAEVRELRGLAPMRAWCGARSAGVSFGGGFHHWSVTVTPGEAPGQWAVDFESEDDRVPARRVTVTVTDRLSPEALRRTLDDNYAAFIRELSRPEDVARAERERAALRRLLAPNP